MTWQVKLSPEAAKWMCKADPPISRRIRDALSAIAALNDPRSRGKALTAGLAGLWRYRVGDYRIICDIQDDELVILAVEMGKRDHIYN